MKKPTCWPRAADVTCSSRIVPAATAGIVPSTPGVLERTADAGGHGDDARRDAGRAEGDDPEADPTDEQRPASERCGASARQARTPSAGSAP